MGLKLPGSESLLPNSSNFDNLLNFGEKLLQNETEILILEISADKMLYSCYTKIICK